MSKSASKFQTRLVRYAEDIKDYVKEKADAAKDTFNKIKKNLTS